MGQVISFPIHRSAVTTITAEYLAVLTERVLREVFADNAYELLQDYAAYCQKADNAPDRYLHFEWACQHLGITEGKSINMQTTRSTQ